MDWEQVRQNGGPPCYALTGETLSGRPKYCGRAERWEGHPSDHPFVAAPRSDEVPTRPYRGIESMRMPQLRVPVDSGERCGVIVSNDPNAYCILTADHVGDHQFSRSDEVRDVARSMWPFDGCTVCGRTWSAWCLENHLPYAYKDRDEVEHRLKRINAAIATAESILASKESV